MNNSMTINIGLHGRPAEYRPNQYAAVRLGVEKGSTLNVEVLGLYQVADGEDVNPYFIVELQDGRVRYASPDEITFVDGRYGVDT